MATTPGGQADIYQVDERGAGWLFLAGSVLGLAGLMRIFDAIWAFGYKGALPEGLKDGVLGDNIKNYAWTWLIVGVVILSRASWYSWVPSSPAGSATSPRRSWQSVQWRGCRITPSGRSTYIGIAVLTFYALARYGGRRADLY